MTQIFLIRHGQADGNLYRRCQGQTDTPLSTEGLAQLPYLTKRFASLELACVYSSDLQRAYTTAKAVVGERSIPLVADARLREIRCGAWENRAWGNIDYDDPAMQDAFLHDPARWSVPGAESFAALEHRLMEALTEIGERHPGETVAVACHGMAIRTILAAVQGVPSERVSSVTLPSNTGVCLLNYDKGHFAVVCVNDVSHLPVPPRVPFRDNEPERNTDLRYTPFDTKNGRELYIRCYADAWRGAHGSLSGFSADACWQSAVFCAREDPEALQAAWWGDRFAGVISLDEVRSAPDAGWISFLYVVPELRHKTFGTQLLGAAVTRYRELGRPSVRLTVAPTNPALRFYDKMLFRCIGKIKGVRKDLFLMEKTI